MRPIELAKLVAEVFGKMGVNYMLVGSVASMYYGRARYTDDVDIVADLKLEQVAEFVKHFPPSQFYISENAVREAIQFQGMFNIFQTETGYRADIFILRPEAFAKAEMAKRKRVEIEGTVFYVSAPEFLILKKLEYYQEGESEKHLRDITAMLEESGDIIDLKYVEEWAGKLGLLEIWYDFLEKFKMKLGKNE